MPESLTLNPCPGTYFLMLRLWSIKLITLQSVLHRGALKVIKDEACAGERAIGAWGRRILQGCSPGADKEAVQEWSSVYSLLGMDSSRFLNFFFFCAEQSLMREIIYKVRVMGLSYAHCSASFLAIGIFITGTIHFKVTAEHVCDWQGIRYRPSSLWGGDERTGDKIKQTMLSVHCQRKGFYRKKEDHLSL